jgi:hypothetical protein
MESTRVLSLLVKLPEATLHDAVDGISHWLSAWDKQIVAQPQFLDVWLKLWPIAVDVTNSEQPAEQTVLPDLKETPSEDSEPAEFDTLNTPIGKLVGVFLASCPPVQSGNQPFQQENAQRSMRNQIEGVLGTAGSIAKYRLIEQMPYFLAADEQWTRNNLVSSMHDDTSEARTLWRAVAHQRLSFKVNKILGDTMADRAIDFHLSRDTRRSLVFRIIVDCLNAFKDQRDPAITHIRIQQMIRSLDDEVRAEGAEAVQRFVHDVSAPRDGGAAPLSAEQLFELAASPFLKEVWPQERSLATPGVSRALADLPATAKEAFAEAVYVIERFLVPFACWSMIEYGLYGEEDDEPKLSIVDDREKASALLKLLDLTIGTSEDSVVPNDLAEALEQIGKVAPDLTERPEFRRLSTAARRG